MRHAISGRGLRLVGAICLALNAAVVIQLPLPAQEREVKVRSDQTRILKEGFWVYNNLPKGLERARETNKPVLVIFRCIPCEACAQLDASVIEDNPAVRKWLNQFIPVRIVHTNGMDMNKFQFDYDQSWAAFVLHADGTIIGRYGTRSHQTESDNDVSLEGFLDSLKVALDVHNNFEQARPQLLAKTGPAAPVASPELFDNLKDKYSSKLDYEGKVVASCIHCHQVGESLFKWHRNHDPAVTPEVLHPYPNPKVLGMVMDPKQARTILSVTVGSEAEQGGLKAGDKIINCQDQPIISPADIQWVLHHLGSQTELKLTIQRGEATLQQTLTLKEGWRKRDDISWRASSWDKRRMVTGGMKLDAMAADELKVLKVTDKAVGLKIKHVGQFTPHDAAKRAGFKVGDVIVKFGSFEQPMTEGQLLAALLAQTKPGDQVSVDIVRGDKPMTLQFSVQ